MVSFLCTKHHQVDFHGAVHRLVVADGILYLADVTFMVWQLPTSKFPLLVPSGSTLAWRMPSWLPPLLPITPNLKLKQSLCFSVHDGLPHHCCRVMASSHPKMFSLLPVRSHFARPPLRITQVFI
nr:unnamed protein product [Digitaria exilis]